MHGSNIQMELLSEIRTPQQVLNYAINRDRGQANEHEYRRAHSNWNTVTYVRPNKQQSTSSSQKPQKATPCRKCGNPLSLAHLQICPAKNQICSICKKIGHYTSLCTAKIPERKTPPRQQLTTPGQYTSSQARRVRHVKPEISRDDSTEGSVDAEAALYKKELHEDWVNINLIRPTIFHNQPNDNVNKNTDGEFWVETVTDQEKLQWLADTGSPRSFIIIDKALDLTNKIPNAAILPYKENTKYRCFNNNNIQIRGVLLLDITSGSWVAKQCKVLIVHNKTNNIMGRDLLAKIGITLNANKPKGKQTLQVFNIQTEKNVIKWILQKYPHLCTRLGRSKNHIAQPIFKENYTPSQHKGRRVPLHLLEKIENELNKLVDEGQIIKLEKCPDELFISPVVISAKKDKSVK